MKEIEQTPKKKPQKTTIAISGEVSERLETYCKQNNILRKEFVELALNYFERTGFDLRENAVDYSPIEKMVNELQSIKEAMENSQLEKAALASIVETVQKQAALQLPAPDIVLKAGEEKATALLQISTLEKEIQEYKENITNIENELQAAKKQNESLQLKLQDIQKKENDTQESLEKIEKENKSLLEYKERAHAELCRIRDEQSYFGKIEVKTDL